MLNYYQPFLLPFLGFKRSRTPPGIYRSYYISFEDILWNLLATKNIPKQSTILIPDFYCMDVVSNIKLHGYKPVFYPLNDHFQIQKKVFEKWRNKYKPSVIILFHACGIQNNFLKDKLYIKQISKISLVIEDAVHRLINPETVNIACTNHVLIDSLRKTSPVNGSFIYSKEKLKHPSKYPELHYQFPAYILFFLFRVALQTGVLCKSPFIVSFAHKTLLKYHDDLIGNSAYGHRGNSFTEIAHSFIQFSRIEQLKNKQSFLYDTQLQPLYAKNSPWYKIRISKYLYKYLHVFPIGLRKNSKFSCKNLEEFLASRGIPTWFKFPDCPWSKTRYVLFLPLGFHVEYNEIYQICRILHAFTSIL